MVVQSHNLLIIRRTDMNVSLHFHNFSSLPSKNEVLKLASSVPFPLPQECLAPVSANNNCTVHKVKHL